MTRTQRLLPLVAVGLTTLGCGGTPTASDLGSRRSEADPPKVEVRGDTINAGDADYARPREFAFTVANTGGQPLELTLALKSCSCADVEVPSPIAPGAAGKVLVRWNPIAGISGAYSLAADVATNDPRKKTIRLVVNAHVQPLVRILINGREGDPDWFGVGFGEEPITPGEKRTREVTVFSTKLRQFKLAASADVPGLDISPPRPLTPGVRLGDHNVASGYKLDVSTTKDVPLGYVRGQLSLALSQLGEGEPDRTITLPIYAMVGQGLFTVTPSMLRFNMPNIADGGTARVNLSFITPPADVDVTVAEVQPSYVQVDKPEKQPDGKWRITAHIPKDNPAAAKDQADPPMIGWVVVKATGLDRPMKIKVTWDPPSK
jgi:hypothetical protein